MSESISTAQYIELLAHQLGIQTYVFGYPLVLMDVTRAVSTNVAHPTAECAPINQFVHKREYPDETFTNVVSPNADTLYSFAFLDLSTSPVVLSLPDVGQRYYLMQLLDGWTNVFSSLGTRTTGNGSGRFLIAGPDWKGDIPKDHQLVQSPTNLVWIIGRTQTNGKDDYDAVHTIQNQYGLELLKPSHSSPSSVDPSIDVNTSPVEQVSRMEAPAFLNRFASLMKSNPPAAADAQMMRALNSIGMVPGRSFDLAALHPSVAKGIESGCIAGQQAIIGEAKKGRGRIVNGWQFANDLGVYGTDYIWRATVALTGLGANIKEDAIYSRATRDANGDPLNGSDMFEITFAKGQLPPVNAFWSITLYNAKNYFAANPIHRFAIGDRDPLRFNSDGSLTLIIQHERPAPAMESNWLPAPAENFTLIMRLYWPRNEVINGSWEPPRVERTAAKVKKAA
jgi:hypothetical protein